MSLKDYQDKALETFEDFLRRYRELGEHAPADARNLSREAFEWSTRRTFGRVLPYVAPPALAERDVPCVCLRIPTGGGKTLVGGHAIARVKRTLLPTARSLTVWLVPTDPIRVQTLRGLRTPGELLHRELRTALGDVAVLDIDEALSVQPSTLDGQDTVIVATMQAFKQRETERLAVYQPNGALMGHFGHGEDTAYSLVEAIARRRPFVIVDEAHNQGTSLAFDTLARLDPCAVLELTATPDRSHQPSNVLVSVSASTLQAEEMIKLPVELATHGDWRVALQAAIACLDMLQAAADCEAARTGERLRPVMLLQAERQSQGADVMTAERVVQALLDQPGVTREAIRLSTGTVDELDGVDFSVPGAPRFVVTVDRLREGWDCPQAYVLMSFRRSSTHTAMEQLLGRVLRMPNVRRKQEEALNRAYAFAASDRLLDVAAGLKDGLVQAGFERQSVEELVQTPQAERQDDLLREQASVSVPLPMQGERLVLPDFSALPEAVRRRFESRVELVPESGTLSIRGAWTPADQEALRRSFPDGSGDATVTEAFARLAAPPARPRTHSENGEAFVVPMLALAHGDRVVDAGAAPALDGVLDLPGVSPRLDESEFPAAREALQRARLEMGKAGEVKLNPVERLDVQLRLTGIREDADAVELVWWLERQLRDDDIDPETIGPWLSQAVDHLVSARGMHPDELFLRRARLRDALARRLDGGRRAGSATRFAALWKDDVPLSVDDRLACVFRQGSYAWDYQYNGYVALARHFFPQIGNLKDRGEEFECAHHIANVLPGVRDWVRNVERKPSSFSLPTSGHRFYPDFLVRMEDGIVLAVEYKGGDRFDAPEQVEKRRVGALWALRSEGRCAFAMPRNRDFDAIDAALAEARARRKS